ncbi:MAG: RHS repeat-associated core domain-containing protein [Candidatus Pacebacteria bacterium]|nr:RHS repeat-associated core domain-containing protein [Candidatus Paceibacterota bacterium]
MIATKGSATSVNRSSVAETYSETAASWSFSGGQNGTIRWYDPQTGRWLSKDPIGISGGLNQCVAFLNNPVNFVDPLGLQSQAGGADWYSRILGRPANQVGAPFDLSRQDLLEEIRYVDQAVLAHMVNPFEIMWRPDTRFRRFDGQAFMFEGRRYEAEEVNYIGVGAAARHFNWGRRALRSAVIANNVLIHGDWYKDGEMYFAMWGRDNYYNALKLNHIEKDAIAEMFQWQITPGQDDGACVK